MKCVVSTPSGMGFTRLELLVVVFICGLLAIPVLVSAVYRTDARTQRINCANNLKQVGLCLKTWALDHEDRFPMTVLSEHGAPLKHIEDTDVSKYFLMLSNVLADPKVLICPADTRLPATNSTNGFSSANLSYFFSLDARDTNPNMFLTGDRNLTNGPLPANHVLVINTNYPLAWTSELHHYQGNIGLADGSVQQFSNPRLIEAFLNTTDTNRLAMP